ncbi:hypothetical protein BDV98DRAFT_598594 [Pterulicium gracile]|uniref:Uncharacterized protein n=1 Tax=Pterulicium gracile TaxID=1884261 RepID=A0A5C3PZX2_9AGAR|nr:hypothetical protein BDV98DRAFT_598594 [Pterula gracilis]
MTLATEEHLKNIYDFSINKCAASTIYPASILEDHFKLKWDTKFRKLKDTKVTDNSETVMATTSIKGKQERKNHNTTNCNHKGGGAHSLTDKEVEAKKAAGSQSRPKKFSIQPEEAHVAAAFVTPTNVTPTQVQKVIDNKCFLVNISGVDLGTLRKFLL